MLVRSWLAALVSQITRQPTRRERRAAGLDGRSRHLHVESLEDRRLMAFDTAVSYPVGSYPFDVVAADFNNDGQLDLATANHVVSSVSVLLGNADGTFQSAIDSPTDESPQSLVVGDFNADDQLDLVTHNFNSVSVLLGNGAGGFSAPIRHFLSSGSPVSVAVGDFNSDGKLDLGVTSNYSFWSYYGTVTQVWANVLLGTGSGTFGSELSVLLDFPAGYPTRSTIVADFNGDGKADFASAGSGVVQVAPGTGTGTLGASIETWGSFGQVVHADDVNADGRLDLIATNSGEGVSVLLGDGLGAFSYSTYGTNGAYAHDADVGDFNGDGRADIAVSTGDGTVGVLLGTGAADAFKPPIFSTAEALYLTAIAVGDFNGDRLADSAATAGSAIVFLNDGDWISPDVPSLSITDVTVTEGNVGTVNATFTVSLSAAYSETVSIDFATAGGSATSNSDFQAAAGTLTFTPGQTSRPITVKVNGDRVAEYTEDFYVRLTSPTNAFVADGVGEGAIANDEPTVSIESYDSVLEGNTSTTEFTFTVTLSAPYDAPVVLPFATADLTPDEEYWYGPAATAGVDYAATAGTVTFEIGQTVQTIKVPIIGDRIAEHDEYFFVNLNNASGALSSNSQALGMIQNDEPYVHIDSASVVEGHVGSTMMNFNVWLSAPYDAPVTIEYATSDGDATAASGDYQATSGSVTFDIGQTTQTISIPVNGDRLGEGNESFSVALNSGFYSNALGTIVDDEPEISITSYVSLTEGHRGTTSMTFTVTLSAAYDQTVTVNYATQNGSATAGSDYAAKSGVLTFAPGEMSKTITVTITGDKSIEADEYFYLVLSNPSSKSRLGNSSGTGYILNDDGGKGRKN